MRHIYLTIFCLLCNLSYSQINLNGDYTCNKIGLTIRKDTLFYLYHLYDNDIYDDNIINSDIPDEGYSCHSGKVIYNNDSVYCTDNYLVTENIRFVVLDSFRLKLVNIPWNLNHKKYNSKLDLDAIKYESDRQLLNEEIIFHRVSIFTKSYLYILENNKIKLRQNMETFKVERFD